MSASRRSRSEGSRSAAGPAPPGSSGAPAGAEAPSHGGTPLSERQAMVLRALVAAYVGQAGPVASGTLAQLLPTSLSPASVRNTLAELHEAGLIDKAHASAGRVPTPEGLGLFVDQLLEVGPLGPHQQRLLAREFEGIGADAAPRQASQVLSAHTRQLGFVVAPRVEQLRLRTLHLVPVAERRVLAVLVTEQGGLIERTIDHAEPLAARDLERIRAHLAERVEGHSLVELRRLLEQERRQLRGEADAFLRQAWALGLEACQGGATTPSEDLVIATRLALLDQPEFSDPGRIRGLFAALETNQRLLALLRKIAHADSGSRGVGLAISLGAELGEPALRDCALVSVPYGEADGALGVIGPQRMDYGRVIPLVRYCSELMTRKLMA